MQHLANTAFAFATAGQMAPTMLDVFSLVDSAEIQGAENELTVYQQSMQCFGRTGQIAAGFALLARAEARGLLSSSEEGCYSMLHTLFEACRAIDDSMGTLRLQAVMKRLGLIALVPVVTVLVRDPWL
eukprot:gnl/TRDRNA2_/TRDRNA2_174420_c18_seq9.p1 gnl/TRDRNA2_/TRDRNA2_174420_c18~~gnl/TRDRNA2_/TRDRNA2_174420_c18_seq9.p1  ORF type:complete len:128 (-),score=16.10 gnl/TRDRNA2_/TRDRNA2_174420_c18_seq9:25-408(-)